ncbi:stage V sporulation protein S-domain-containing protein [Dunaliella salina]|uniref:Stage V sporulation protein S-domain-containing protein n=1 Tax=Dunaliella salina TaxID=3046 RepID=A0ABQ7GPS6_DUNSA|nr:stage V sporulation protein S-domain-containing protein [Dunaliella salina]|eukprot:KAF5836609.1 stage V sporulation protein S-domain-containing protein [Dunaliella salina]
MAAEHSSPQQLTAVSPDEEAQLAAGRYIKVSAASQPKGVAGKLSHSAREGEPPATLCIGAASINQAVKSICIARQYLTRDGLNLSFQPAFRDKDRRANVALYVAKQPLTANDPMDAPAADGDAEYVELPISAHSKAAVVAGALAARVREGKRVSLVSIGVDAVSNAVLTIGNARLYLEENTLDVRAFPTFITVQKEGKQLNAVKFNIKVEQL